MRAVSAPFVHSERVRFGDLDAMRHLNNVVFLRYFESARIAFIRSLVNHDPAHPEDGDFGVIFAECHIAYRSPVHFDEVVDVECSVGEIRRSAFQVKFEMKVGDRTGRRGLRLAGGLQLRRTGRDAASRRASRRSRSRLRAVSVSPSAPAPTISPCSEWS